MNAKGKTLAELCSKPPGERLRFMAMVSEKGEVLQIARDMKAIRFRRLLRESRGN